MKLGARLVLVAIALAAASAGGASWLALREVSRAMEEDARRHAEEVTRALAESLYVPVMLEDRTDIAARLHDFGLEEGVLSAHVTAASGADLGASPARAGAANFEVSAEVRARGLTPPSPVTLDEAGMLEPGLDSAAATVGGGAPAGVAGLVRVQFTLAGVRASIARITKAVLLVTLLLFALAAGSGAIFATSIVRPLRRLEEATARVARGDLASPVDDRGADEVASLARSFNEMVRAVARSREEVRAAAVELARREHFASLGQFTSVVAHEIRNPLGIILSSAQVAGNDARTVEQRREALTFIAEEVRRLDRILTDFLKFARPRTPAREAVDLRALAARGAAHHEAHDDVTVRAEGGPPVNAMADPELVTQVLLNLVRNACEAGAKNVVLRAGVGDGGAGAPAAPAGPAAWIEVADDGPGFAPEANARAGEPFFTTKVHGSGLGLATVRQIAAAHGGRLEILRAEPSGARIRIYWTE